MSSLLSVVLVTSSLAKQLVADYEADRQRLQIVNHECRLIITKKNSSAKNNRRKIENEIMRGQIISWFLIIFQF